MIKRLPDIPFIYNQVKLKLDDFTLRIDSDDLKTCAELTGTIKLIGQLADFIVN
jgi:hypothetical protein